MPEWPAIETLYSKAAEFFSRVEWRLRRDGLPFYGFKLLNAPPMRRPDFMFVGFQPGGGADAHENELALGSDHRWPDKPEFVTAQWHLATRMQEIFPREVLLRSMGSNLVFLRWPSIRDYRRAVPWDVRDEVEEFSRRILCEIMDIVQPQRVVTIGFNSLQGDATAPDLVSPAGRVLTKRGVLCGREVVGMLHLTGCRISGTDRMAIKKCFA